MGSTVKFRVRMGSNFARNPVLLVNLPMYGGEPAAEEETKGVAAASIGLKNDPRSNGGSGDTAARTSPLKSEKNAMLGAMLDENSDKINAMTSSSQFMSYTMTQPVGPDGQMPQMGPGWQLSTTQLTRVLPNRIKTGQRAPSQTYYEFSVQFQTAGSFFVQLEYGKRPSLAQQDVQSCLRYTNASYINVEPLLQLGQDEIKCKELSICTVISRCLGQAQRWPQVLANLRDQNYNAVHFTPIQEYGESFSHYSIADQTEISDFFFHSEEQKSQTSRLSKDSKFQEVQRILDEMRRSQKMLGIIDIVLNHTANNSKWIQDHPEACYNTDDMPRLWPAYLLDYELTQISKEFSQGRVSWCPSAPYLNNENDLNQVIAEMTRRVLQLKLHEFFLCHFDQNEFLGALQGQSSATLKAKIQEFTDLKLFEQDCFEVLQEHFIQKLAHGPQRMQVSLKQPDAAIFFAHLNQQNMTRALEQVSSLIQRSNDYWTATVTRWMDEAMVNCRGTMRYFKLQLGNNLIKDDYLLDPYFSSLQNEQQSKVVHNGWIGDHNPLVDFGEEKDFAFLRRQVNIWGDSIKLRYGDCPAASPFLWAHMSEYVSQMARLFDGFRLDNAHSTPMHVCQYMLQVARSQNPRLLIMAELFTSSAELDALFTTRLNINGMIREIMNKGDVQSVGAYFHEITCREQVLGKLDQEFESIEEPMQDGTSNMYQILTPTKPSDIIYDCTHDNPSPLEKFGSRRLALPTIGLLGLADQIIASTWGYDQLLPKNVSVINEESVYPVQSSTRQDWGGQDQEQQRNLTSAIEYVFRYTSGHNCQSVSVAGEFNDWQKDQLYLNRQPGTNNWSVQISVDRQMQGRRVQFKFVEDGSRWCVSHTLPKIDDGHGNENNYFELGESRRAFDTQHQVKKQPDIRVARMLLNRAHKECTQQEAGIFMHSQTDDTIVVVRQLPLAYNDEYDAYVTVQRFCFSGANPAAISTTVELPGFLSEVVFAANMVDNYQLPSRPSKLASGKKVPSRHPKWPETEIECPGSDIYMHNSLQAFARVVDGSTGSRLEFFNLPQGFTCLVKTRCQAHIKRAVRHLDDLWSNASAFQLAEEQFKGKQAGLTLTDINHVLYRCDNEEKDISNQQRGPYGLPESGQFVYAGLQGPLHILQQLKVSGDMGHPLLDNIRQGDWLMEYTQSRIQSQLSQMPRLQPVYNFLCQTFNEVKKLPAQFKPKYVCRVMEKTFNAILSLLINNQMSDQVAFQKTPDPFLQQMVLACAQMYGKVPSATFRDSTNTMCAGLPHFSTGYTRCWGRDTFIALRGLLLTTGLFKEAKNTILYFAKVERHGLIPNLHDSGNNTRFNARDATWFFLQAIKDYCLMVEDGHRILSESFEAEFESRWVITLEQLIIKILQAHASGINFREMNAGPAIDQQMKDNGFNVKIEADLSQTGFCFGGNNDNCGTWMDKMGSAPLVNKGVPATPRDGAPVELVGLQYSVLTFLAQLHKEGKFAHQGVQEITFEAWADLIKASFNKCFYVPPEQALGNMESAYQVEERFVNRRGIYKDTFKSSHVYTDYQLRPNICIAMAVAPELFDVQQAKNCLQIIEQVLMTEDAMGIKTLDPSDKKYKGDYDNDDDTCGHNYHQGPEWVWPVGFFLISKLNFYGYSNQRDAAHDIARHLLPHQKHMLKDDPWHSLPELTNSNGKICHHSCTAQAWSIATLLDALHRLGNYQPTTNI